ncbi:basic salivary proline-rich protein 1-like [Meriones unguiculatus]|uniref:basic salivary proline-rich protein 1-like n=1 Tax=Meriones unguiculatus TaxID=10047 RepID=UPI00293E8B83|nr:basic salivary proline-rich protein 1-like [Meriones unguiculatus]
MDPARHGCDAGPPRATFPNRAFPAVPEPVAAHRRGGSAPGGGRSPERGAVPRRPHPRPRPRAPAPPHARRRSAPPGGGTAAAGRGDGGKRRAGGGVGRNGERERSAGSPAGTAGRRVESSGRTARTPPVYLLTQPDSGKTRARRAGGRYRPHTVHGLGLDQKDLGPPRAAPGSGSSTPPTESARIGRRTPRRPAGRGRSGQPPGGERRRREPRDRPRDARGGSAATARARPPRGRGRRDDAPGGRGRAGGPTRHPSPVPRGREATPERGGETRRRGGEIDLRSPVGGGDRRALFTPPNHRLATRPGTGREARDPTPPRPPTVGPCLSLSFLQRTPAAAIGGAGGRNGPSPTPRKPEAPAPPTPRPPHDEANTARLPQGDRPARGRAGAEGREEAAARPREGGPRRRAEAHAGGRARGGRPANRRPPDI